jgi:hypothetical protein
MITYMSLVKTPNERMSGEPPPAALMEKMGVLIAEMNAKGKMITTGGLTPSSDGVWARIEGQKINITDGPFTEAKEVIGGFAIMRAETREEMLEDARRFLQAHIDCGITDIEIEVRPMVDPNGPQCG